MGLRPFCAFVLLLGTLQAGGQSSLHRTLTTGGGQIHITLPDAQFSHLSNNDLIDWVRTAAVISVGRNTPRDDLFHDWTMTHEMIHLAFPNMERRHHWIEEGISIYVEPVARAAVGQMTPEEVWKQFIENMPKGEPEAGDQGLDVTHTWGRTYWGGAMFCLLADVQIRERTHNQKGLRDALRAILDHGGRITEDWTIEKAFSIGDKATGTHVLMSLYRQMSNAPATVDLDGLWKKLGVSVVDGKVKFDDEAPEAEVRKAISR